MHIVGEGGSKGLGQTIAKCEVQHYFAWLNYSGAVTVVICCEYIDNNQFLYTVVLATYLESLWSSSQVTVVVLFHCSVTLSQIRYVSCEVRSEFVFEILL